ncbi:MAG: S8 family peptidase [Polyangiaceae bacterium]
MRKLSLFFGNLHTTPRTVGTPVRGKVMRRSQSRLGASLVTFTSLGVLGALGCASETKTAIDDSVAETTQPVTSFASAASSNVPSAKSESGAPPAPIARHTLQEKGGRGHRAGRISTSTLILEPREIPAELAGNVPGKGRGVAWLQRTLGPSVRVVSAHWLDARKDGSPRKLVVSVEKTGEEQIRAALDYAATSPNVKATDTDPVWTLDSIPNDPLYPQQWSLPQVNAPQAWDVVTGSPDVVVAVIDSGVDFTHPDLSSAIWNNPADPPDGVDNDGNGLVDDSHGWNFASNNNDLKDLEAHGTHIAGIIAATRNNATGIAGVASGVKIMAIQVHTLDYLNASAVTRGIYYAADHGAKVINLSLGGPDNFWDSRNAIDYALSKGAIVVASAGNGSDTAYNYPAIYQNALAVAALEQTDRRAGFSNYGSWVDISAPGRDILSTVPPNLANGEYYWSGSGTSQAAPIVSGVAALVFSQHPTWTPQQVRNQLLSTAQSIATQNPDYVGQLGAGRVDANAAVGPVVSAPRAYVASVQLNEAPGNGNQQVDPGEAARLTLGVHFTTAGTFTAQLTSATPGVTVTSSPITVSAEADRVGVSQFQLQVATSVARDTTANLSLRLSNAAGAAYTLPVTVSVAPTYAMYELPYAYDQTLVPLPNGKQLLVSDRADLFYENPRSDEVYAAVREANGSFSHKTTISAMIDRNARRPQAVVAPNGDVHVAFFQGVAQNDYAAFPAYARYNVASNTWTTTELFTSGNQLRTTGERNVSVALDSSGTVHIAWVSNVNDQSGVTLIRGTAGQWSTQTFVPYPTAATYDVQLLNTNVGLRLFVRPVAEGSSRREPVMMQSYNAGTWSAPVSTQPVNQYDQTQAPFELYGNAMQFYQGRGSDIVRLSQLNGSVWTDSQAILNINGVNFLTGFTALVNPNLSFLVRSVPETFGSTRELVSNERTVRLAGDRRMLAANPKLFRDSSWKLHGFLQEQVPRALFTGFYTRRAYTTYATDAAVSSAALPTVPTVTGVGVTTATGSKAIDASWSSSHPQGFDSYVVAVGTTPGSDDIVRWQPTLGTSLRLDFGDQRLFANQRVYVSVKAESNGVYQSSLGVSSGILVN